MVKKVYFLVLAYSMVNIRASNWTELPQDPIYTPYTVASLPDDYFPYVIFNPNKFDGNGAAFLYKMWHQGPTGIALSYSNDGIAWQLVGVVLTDPIIAPNIATHPSVLYDKNGFGGTPYHYKMWYWTANVNFVPPNLGIKFTQSIDGITWTTPINTTQDVTHFLSDNTQGGTSPFYQFYGFGQVIYNARATSTPGKPFTFPYIVFFDSSAAQIAPQNTQEAVGLAYSNDGIFWTRFGTQPVLLPSGSTAVWDGKFAYRASVLEVNGAYHMFYSGSSGINNPDPNFAYTFGIGHAYSQDGINWTRDPKNPIFTVLDAGQAWRSGRTLAPTVLMTMSPTCQLLHMWFSGGTNAPGGFFSSAAIGYAANLFVIRDSMWLLSKLSSSYP